MLLQLPEETTGMILFFLQLPHLVAVVEDRVAVRQTRTAKTEDRVAVLGMTQQLVAQATLRQPAQVREVMGVAV